MRKYKSRNKLLSPLFNIEEEDEADELRACVHFPTEGAMVLLGAKLDLLGCAISADPAGDAFQVHYWGTTNLSLPLKGRVFKPGYYDPFSERRVYTHMPPAHFRPMVDTVFRTKTLLVPNYAVHAFSP